MTLTKQEAEVEASAIAFARKHKGDIATRLTDIEIYRPEREPVSVFMAGSPGAGKTEASLELLDSFSNNIRVLRIDPDELRSEFPGYTGGNAYLYQSAVRLLLLSWQYSPKPPKTPRPFRSLYATHLLLRRSGCTLVF